MVLLVLSTVAVLALEANAQFVFGSYASRNCQSDFITGQGNLLPGNCYPVADLGHTTSTSIYTIGLDGDNYPNTYMEVYHDNACKNVVTDIHYSGYCEVISGQSIMLWSSEHFKRQAENATEPEDEAARKPMAPSLLAKREANGLADIDARIQGDLKAHRDEAAAKKAAKTPAARRSVDVSTLVPRYTGERTEWADGEFAQIEVEDDNAYNDGHITADPQGFQFRDAEERNNFVQAAFGRIRAWATNNPTQSRYTGTYVYNGHEIDLEFAMDDDTAPIAQVDPY